MVQVFRASADFPPPQCVDVLASDKHLETRAGLAEADDDDDDTNGNDKECGSRKKIPNPNKTKD